MSLLSPKSYNLRNSLLIKRNFFINFCDQYFLSISSWIFSTLERLCFRNVSTWAYDEGLKQTTQQTARKMGCWFHYCVCKTDKALDFQTYIKQRYGGLMHLPVVICKSSCMSPFLLSPIWDKESFEGSLVLLYTVLHITYMGAMLRRVAIFKW